MGKKAVHWHGTLSVYEGTACWLPFASALMRGYATHERAVGSKDFYTTDN